MHSCQPSRSLSILPVLFSGLAILALFALPAHSQDVLTYHNNNTREGLDSQETILTLTNVNSGTFGRLFTIPISGLVDAQPLYVSAVTVAGAVHNLLVVASENGFVYGFDADTGTKLWQQSTLKSGETTSDNRGCGQVSPEIGITSTPVITRPTGSNPVIYVVAMSKDASGDYHQRLHALDATTGNELYKGPVDIAAKYPGTGDNSSGGNVIFDPAQYKERPGLLWVNGAVYLAFSSHCDDRPYTGWIMGYNGTTLAQTTVLNLTPNANEGAIWNSGAGMGADNSGNIFVVEANGVFDGTVNAAGFPTQGDYGNAILRLSTTKGLAVTDYFEMSNQESENGGDVDLGSGGGLLVSLNDKTGKTWNLIVAAGKDGNLYIVDRGKMGKYNSSTNNIYQQLNGVLPGGIWSMPAYFQGKLYYAPVNSPMLAFEFKNAMLLPAPVAKTVHSFQYPGATPSVSANGTTNAIVWVAENSSPAVLHAFNALNLQEIYNTNQAANARDQFGNGNKFVTPTIAHGKVYVTSTTGVGVFGLLP
jgi:putative pyrroloquinoline-quinone binding quinoprotein